MSGGSNEVTLGLTLPGIPVLSTQDCTQDDEQKMRWCPHVKTTSSHMRDTGSEKWAT